MYVMKIYLIVSRFLIFLIIFPFIISFTSCSDDDDDEITCSTFLECNDASKWKYVESDDGIELITIFLRLNNDKDNPFEIWLKFLSDCYEYGSSDNSESTFQIIENSKYRFIIKIIDGSDFYETWTFTVQDDILKIVIVSVDDGDQDEDTLLLNPTSENLNNLNICED